MFVNDVDTEFVMWSVFAVNGIFLISHLHYISYTALLVCLLSCVVCMFIILGF